MGKRKVRYLVVGWGYCPPHEWSLSSGYREILRTRFFLRAAVVFWWHAIRGRRIKLTITGGIK